MFNPTDELCAKLGELGIKYTTDDSNDYEVIEWRGSYDLWWQFVYDPYVEEPYGELRLLDTGSTNLTPKQAIDVTVGDKQKDNPRNYNPDGTPKIPNMHIGADPDWVDWVARLKHEEPLSLKEAVEQLMFETICFGGDMGPNDCGGEHCPDEGMVYTNDFINGWVSKIDVTVGTEPDEATMLKLHDRMNAALLDYESAMGIDGGSGANTVPSVNEMHQIIEDAAKAGVGTCHCTTPDDAWCFSCSSCGKSFPRNELHMAYNHGEINYCPNCGAKVIGG